MSDPRGRGFNRSNAYRHPVRPKPIDRPTNHGWVEDSVSEIDGCIIFRLNDIALMKADIDAPGQWLGNIRIDGQWKGFIVNSLPLAQITEQVRQMANSQREEESLTGDEIFRETLNYECDEAPEVDDEPAPFERYGLVGTR